MPSDVQGGRTTKGRDRQDETGLRRMAMLPTPAATPYGSSNNGCPGDGREVYAQRGKPSLETMARRDMWPTPSARDYKDTPGMARTGVNPDGSTRQRTDQLARVVYDRMWPTPTAGDAKASGSRNTESSKAHPGISLTDAIREDGGRGRLWPTPVARDAESLKKVMRGAGSMDRGQERIAPLAVEVMRRDFPLDLELSDSSLEQTGGQLNPTWVEWLMGMPLGWTVVAALSPSETRSSRKSRRS